MSGVLYLVRITTWSGSVYLLDFDRRRVMRIGGSHTPTPRLGSNHVWKPLADMGMPWSGRPYELIWGYGSDGDVLSTITSEVQQIEVVPLSQ